METATSNSPECLPLGDAQNSIEKHGQLVGVVEYKLATSTPTFSPIITTAPTSSPEPCGHDINTDPNNCGACGIQCNSNQNCRSGKCAGTGEIQVTLTWNRPAIVNLWIFPPVMQTYSSHENSLPTVVSAYGAADLTESIMQTLGPENIYWNSNLTLQPVQGGTYTVVSWVAK